MYKVVLSKIENEKSMAGRSTKDFASRSYTHMTGITLLICSAKFSSGVSHLGSTKSTHCPASMSNFFTIIPDPSQITGIPSLSTDSHCPSAHPVNSKGSKPSWIFVPLTSGGNSENVPSVPIGTEINLLPPSPFASITTNTRVGASGSS